MIYNYRILYYSVFIITNTCKSNLILWIVNVETILDTTEDIVSIDFISAKTNYKLIKVV